MRHKRTHNSTGPSASSTGQRRPGERPARSRNRGGHQRFQNITGAGTVIFKRRGQATEIFFVKNAYGRWTFPKGKQEPGEQLENTAAREAREEAGLTDLKLIAPLGRTTFRFRHAGQAIQKTVHFFLFEAPPEAKEVMTGVEGGMWEAKWVPLQDAIITNGYQNLDRLLSKALRIIAYEERKSTGLIMKPNLKSRY